MYLWCEACSRTETTPWEPPDWGHTCCNRQHRVADTLALGGCLQLQVFPLLLLRIIHL